MNNARMYELAAAEAEARDAKGDNNYSCCCIWQAWREVNGKPKNYEMTTEEYNVVKPYQKLFCEKPEYDSAFWLSSDAFTSYEERNQWRITALCFAAAMAETGDLV